LAASPLLLLPGAVAKAAELKADGAAEESAEAAPGESWAETTAKSERAVRRGVDFLMKTMHRDGGCGVDIGQPADIGCTAMVGLALMSQGNTPVEGPKSREVRNIVSYMLRVVENMPSDDITNQVQTQLQNKIGRHAHSFFAATFLAEVVGEGWDVDPPRAALE
jgi:hypothetical protein